MYDLDYFKKVTRELFAIDSPSGYTHNAMSYLKAEIEQLGWNLEFDQKGNGIVSIESGIESLPTLGIACHVDTLGLMVKSISSNGTLLLTAIGGPIINTLDGEYCNIYTRDNKKYTGTILSKSPSSHVYKDASSLERNLENMEVRIDEVVKNKDDVLKLNINTGDYVCYDPKTTITDNGFIKSRFLDDKIVVALILTMLKQIKEQELGLKYNLKIIFSTYEEIGYGASYIPNDITELLAIDMGCVGADLSGNEYSVSICVKDSSGPYDYHMTTNLINLAKKNNLDYAVDVYPYYGSDASAALRGGNNIKAALIGPGVHASHGMERCHIKAIENTIKLLTSYICN